MAKYVIHCESTTFEGGFNWYVVQADTSEIIAGCSRMYKTEDAARKAGEAFLKSVRESDDDGEVAASMPGHPKVDDHPCPACAEAPVPNLTSVQYDEEPVSYPVGWVQNKATGRWEAPQEKDFVDAMGFDRRGR